MSDILYKVAYNEKGELMDANNANEKEIFFCPECNKEMILHKAGNGENYHRSHFQHKAVNPECNSESYLHCVFKLKLENLLKSHLSENRPFYIKWRPDYYEERTCDLLKTTKDIVHEKKIKTSDGNPLYQPDITLINKNGREYVAIEIVVSHAPESKTLDFYSEKKIFLFQIQLDPKSSEIFEHIEEIAARPDIFTYTGILREPPLLFCALCGKELKIAKFKFGKTHCPKCNANVKIPWIEWKSKAGMIMRTTVDGFSVKEIEFALANGCVITKRISKSQYHITYYTVDCPECGEKGINFNSSMINPQENCFDWYYCPNCHSPQQIKKYRN